MRRIVRYIVSQVLLAPSIRRMLVKIKAFENAVEKFDQRLISAVEVAEQSRMVAERTATEFQQLMDRMDRIEGDIYGRGR